MIKYTNLSQLAEGKNYALINNQYNVTNRIIFICGDYRKLGRPIGYFIYSERGYKIPTKEEFIKGMLTNNLKFKTFALWQHEIDTNLLEICN